MSVPNCCPFAEAGSHLLGAIIPLRLSHIKYDSNDILVWPASLATMVRSDEAKWWFNAVYEAVQQIPHGRVTSYGHIARLLGKRMNPPSDRHTVKLAVLLRKLLIGVSAECPRSVASPLRTGP